MGVSRSSQGPTSSADDGWASWRASTPARPRCRTSPSRRGGRCTSSSIWSATRESYAAASDKYIALALGGYELRAITAPLVADMLADLRGGGVHPQAVRRTKAILTSCLSRALEQGLIHGNPAAGVKLPRPPQRPSMAAVDPRQVEALRTVLGPRHAAVVSVLAYVGLRPGEALALRWSDIGGARRGSSARTTTG